jgi:predicted AAA+ superfamily ATPase
LGDVNYIQVAWLLLDENAIEREFGALAKIRDNDPKILLTTDAYTQNRDGIKHQNVFQWLLDLE